MRRVVPAALLLVLALVAASCASRRQEGPAGPEAARTTVRVENQNFLDMNIYVISGTQRVRLGTAPGVSTRVFTIPSNLVFGIATLSFQADPVGSNRTPISHEISVRAGDQVQLTIPNY